MITAEQDWILQNIRNKMKESDTKVEVLGKYLEISGSEVSKILHGQRKNYFHYLPKIADFFRISFHELVQPSNHVQNNYGNIQSHGIGYLSTQQFSNDSSINSSELYERIISEMKDKIALLQDLLETERAGKQASKGQ